MYSALSAGAIGVSVSDLASHLAAAKMGGFAGIELGGGALQEAAQAPSLLTDAGVKAAGFGLPVDFRQDTPPSNESLDNLRKSAAAAASIGLDRCATWILPMSDTRTFDENFEFHVSRLAPLAAILAEEGVRFGLEFVGTPSLRAAGKYEFVYDLAGMMKLADAVSPNAGLLLDCWHWHTSEGTVEDIEAVPESKIVYVHVNDAPEGVALAELQDNDRRLPLETGVIDLAGFIGALRKIGYEGPVVAEPFSSRLKSLESDEARLQETGESLRKLLA